LACPGGCIETAWRSPQYCLVLLQCLSGSSILQQQVSQHVTDRQQCTWGNGVLVHAILVVRGSTQQTEAVVLCPFGESDQRDRGFKLCRY
jgi:hypothetical protein